MRPKTVSILGCGWLGLPLGEHLARQGYRVKGSTTTPEKLADLEQAGIEPHLLVLNPGPEGVDLQGFFEADVLFLNVPPGRRDPEQAAQYPEKVRAVRDAARAAGIGWIVLASSTSVYPDLNRVVVEADAGDPGSTSGAALLVAETILRETPGLDATILRFAGLYGYSRHPGRFLARRRALSGGDAPVNLIHLDDCIPIVQAVLEQEVRGEVLNACADEHPTRREVYVRAAEALGVEPPSFADEAAPAFKIVSNEKLKARLGYRFRYPDPRLPAP